MNEAGDTGNLFAPGLKGVLQRFTAAKGPERDQAIIRLSVIVYIHFFLQRYPEDVSPRTLYWVTLASVFYAVVVFISIIVSPKKNTFRRFGSLHFDIGIPSYIMCLTGAETAWLYLVNTWCAYGYPFRYGKKYLYYTTLINVVTFGAVIHFSPFYRQYPELAWGLLVGLVAEPFVFVGIMVKRVQDEMEKAEIANKAKSLFVSNMSHELRTPLNGILGTLELLAGTRMDLEQQEYVQNIRSSGEVLLTQVNDVLDFSKIEAGRLTIVPEEMDLHALLKKTASVVFRQIRAKGLAFRVVVAPDVPFLVNGDANRIRQVVTNLLSNAVKFTQEGQITLRLLRESEEGAPLVVRFEVTDTGIGMSEEQQKRIFDRFTQADTSITRKYGGTGLGTTISKELAELMGGRIGVQSMLGKGSTFWFTVPVGLQPEKNLAMAMKAKLSRTRITMVSNDDRAAASINGFLLSWNVRNVHRASNTGEAYDHIARIVKDASTCHVVIVVRKGLNECPFRFAEALERMGALRTVRLLLVEDGRACDRDVLLEGAQYGYRALAPSVEAVGHLINAIHYVLPFGESWGIPASDDEEKGRHPLLNILVAEDNEINQVVVCRLLEREGHRVKAVSDGRQALEALRNERFDVALLDLNMPVMGGLEAARKYLAWAGETAIPLIALTADATVEKRKETEAAGFQVYISKPFEAKRVFSAIYSVIRKEPEAPVGEGNAQLALGLPKAAAPESSRRENAPAGILDHGFLKEVEAMGPSPEFVKNLVWIFIRDSEKHIRTMERAADSGNVGSFCDAAHALKGMAGQMGALTVMDLASRLQHMTDGYTMADRLETLEEVRAAISVVKRTLLRKISVNQSQMGEGSG
jgi:two-component system, sensor histidine kinase RpfC